MPICQLPFTIVDPVSVEDNTDGILANVDINKNLTEFIGNNPAIYTSKSFGVPGTKIILA